MRINTTKAFNVMGPLYKCKAKRCMNHVTFFGNV